MKATYAAFKARPYRDKEGKWHVYRRDQEPGILGDFRSICGSAEGIGTVADVKNVNCLRCKERMKT